jgi:hypothetical protein
MDGAWWQVQLLIETQTMIPGDLSYVEKGGLGKLKGEMGNIERMLKVLIKSLKKQTHGPLNPRPLEPFLPTNWEKRLIKRHDYSGFDLKKGFGYGIV